MKTNPRIVIAAIIVGLIGLGAIVTLRSGKRQPGAEREISVLVIAPLTGSGAALGQSARLGMELALKENNSASPRVSLNFQDSRTDPATAKRIFSARRLHANSDVVISEMSQVTRSLVPEADREGVLLLATTVGVPGIGGGSRNFLRINVMSDAIAPPLARFAARRVKTAAILYLNDDYGQANRDLFKSAFERAGGKLLVVEPFEGDPAVARTLIEKVVNSKAEACFIAGYGATYPALFARFKELAPDIKIFADIGLANAPVFKAVGDSAEGVFLAATLADEFPAVSPGAKEIASKFLQTGTSGRPDYVFAFAYDAVTALVGALRATPSGNAQAIRAYMMQQQVRGLGGLFHFDPVTGDSVYADLPIFQVRKGELVRQPDEK